VHLHPLGPTPATLDEAAEQQERLRPLVDATGPGPADLRTVAGIDVAHRDGTDDVVAAVVVLDATTLRPVETRTARGGAGHPYEPGFLALRELPAVTAVLEELADTPDLIVCDGAGVAHPRRFGLACHVGLLTDVPTIGVAKSPPAPFTMPKPARGSWTPQVDGDEVAIASGSRRRATTCCGWLGTACRRRPAGPTASPGTRPCACSTPSCCSGTMGGWTRNWMRCSVRSAPGCGPCASAAV
jgi:deoxyribonuclease V